MKIQIILIGPVFKEIDHGGSQKTLREIAEFLGIKGHKVTILCTSRKENNTIFKLGRNVTVKPILLFKETYPSPYETAPFKLAETIKIIQEHTENTDVVYCHDSQTLLFQSLCKKTPLVCSFRDLSYNETLGNAFIFERDSLIVNSEYSKNCVISTIGRFKHNIHERIKIIKNGVNLKRLYKKKSDKLRKEFKISKNKKIILFPHRADNEKGIAQAIMIIKGLVNKGFKDILLLIPSYIDKNKNKEADEFYNVINSLSKKLKIENNIKIHPWIPHKRMSEYYSLGDITLCIGNAAETFGSNVALESLSCGTIPILSMSGAQRTTLPDWIAPKVDVFDIESTIKICEKILKGKLSNNYKKTREFLKKEFSYKNMLESYERIITNTKISPPLKSNYDINLKKTNHLSLAPWCYISKKRLYLDYEKKYFPIKKVHKILANKVTASLQYLISQGITKSEIDREFGKTIVLTINKNLNQ